jgi:hypothetical protein
VTRSVLGVALVVATGAIVAVILLRGGGEKVRPPPPQRLLRSGTEATFTRAADLDGDGVDEMVLAARATQSSPFRFPAQFLDVYAYRDGGWRRVLDATGAAPPGEGAPDRMLDPVGRELTSRLVDAVAVVDMAGDGASEVAVGVLTVGAGPGPLELWILSMEDGVFRTELYERTTRGGEISVQGRRLLFEFGIYRSDDPGCCPSRTELQVIGFDPRTAEVAVLDRNIRKGGP